MRERVLTFGPEGGLVGVLTEPAPGAERAGAPVVVLTNIGMNHRVGPFRLNVELARRFAARGWSTLRFDLSGRGDSAARREALGDRERLALDVKDALDALARRRGARHFALVGLCSGVDAVHAAAVADPRVVAVTWLDGYGYPTRGYWLRWYTLRYLEGASWRRALALWRQARAERRSDGAPRELAEQPAVFEREYPAPATLARELEALADRGVRQLFVYTSGARTEVTSAGQFFSMLAPSTLAGRVEVELWPDADHLFSTRAQREQLGARLERWLDAVPAAAPARTG